MIPTLRGKLLVAAPTLKDPNFERTVVLLLEHGAEGALGIVLNRPSDTPLTEALADWAPLASPPAVVYVGGPVAIGTIIALARADGDDLPAGVERISEHFVTVDLASDPTLIATAVSALRVWTGYAGWAAGQLEAELAEDAWFVVDAQISDATSPEPSLLWRRVLGRQPGTRAWLSNFPADPAQN
jgi:putative transcriptional regulator